MLISLALVASACGDDSGGTDAETEPPAGEPLSAEEYVDQVDDALAPIASESETVISRASRARSSEDLARPLGDLRETLETAARDLESLEPPEEAADVHPRLVETQREFADALGEAQRQAERGNIQEAFGELRAAGDRYRERGEQISKDFQERGLDL
ncbi:MAG TPA: hypothetical protein VGR10_00035 [Thermoleophilaceae bacterium]|nr:hypothetical protein [Thermoleophilaceae bacterium]